MDLQQLRYFQMAAYYENFSRAAQELFVTQPNLSKSIQRLEEELGMPLFEHRKGKVLLNDNGRVFLASVNRSLEELDRGVRTVRNMALARDNFVPIGCSINSFLPDVLLHFAHRHSEIGIRQVEGTTEDLLHQLQQGTVEIAIVPEEITDSRFRFELLGEKEYVLLVGEGNPLYTRDSVSVKELKEETFICDTSRMGEQILRKICKANGFEPNIPFEVENTQLIYQLLQENAGICFMPMTHLAKLNREDPQGGVRGVAITEQLPSAVIGLVSLRSYSFTNASKTFVSFLKEWLDEEHSMAMKLME